MLAVKSMNVRDHFRTWCDRVIGGETIIVSRPRNENVVILSETEFNELQKAKRNAAYLEKLDRSFEQLAHGEVVMKSMDELEQMADE